METKRKSYLLFVILVITALILSACAVSERDQTDDRDVDDIAAANALQATTIAELQARLDALTPTATVEIFATTGPTSTPRVTGTPTAPANGAPTILVNGQQVLFPQTADEMLKFLKAQPCPDEDQTGLCVELKASDITPDERNDKGYIISWIWARQANSQAQYRRAYIQNQGDLMQNAFMVPPYRFDCGITPNELQQLGYERGIGAGLPAHSNVVAVEGFSFFADPPLKILANQTWAARCDGKENPEIIEALDHEGILDGQSNYTMGQLISEFKLDATQVTIENEGAGCWHVTGKDGKEFQMSNGRTVKLDGWIPPDTTGVPAGYSGPVFGFSVCGSGR